MTHRASSTKKGNRSKISEAASSAVVWLIVSGILAACFTLVAADQVTLGPKFIYGLIAAWTLASVIGTLVIWRLQQEKGKETGETKKWPFTLKQTMLGFAVLIFTLAAGCGLDVGIREIEENTNERKAKEARLRFAVTSYQYDGGDFNPEAVNQTLAELEDSFQNLKDYWTLPEQAPRIKVWLFRDLSDYQLRMNTNLAAGHLWCSLEIDSVELGPVIAIPLEKAPSASSGDNFSRTPTHEMVHALMCQSMGEKAFRSTPRWYLEGVAERFETEGLARIRMRATDRMKLWLGLIETPEPERFCARHFTEKTRVNQQAFYRTSHEFIRSLESRHGIERINQIVEDVRTGISFDESVRNRLKGTCSELYTQWKNSY